MYKKHKAYKSMTNFIGKTSTPWNWKPQNVS